MRWGDVSTTNTLATQPLLISVKIIVFIIFHHGGRYESRGRGWRIQRHERTLTWDIRRGNSCRWIKRDGRELAGDL
jgi:hypothetical protein